MKRLPSSFVSSFLLHEHLTSNFTITVSKLSPAALSILHSYLVCFLVVEFDNDIGPDLKLITPSYKFNEVDFQNICFNSLPEKTSSQEENMEYMFRIECTTDEIIQNEMIFPHQLDINPTKGKTFNFNPENDGNYQNPMFVYVNFSQIKNTNYPRGYQQQSLVLVSRHKLPKFFFKLLNTILDDQIGFLGMSIEEKYPVLEGALVGISNWPAFEKAMKPGGAAELGFLGEVIVMDLVCDPKIIKPRWRELIPHFPLQYQSLFSSALPYYLSSLSSALSLSSSRLVPSLSLLYHIIQLLLLEVPIMVFSSAPDLCSNLVLAAVDLLNPSIKYRGHICEYTSLNSLKESSRGDIIGVCNPFIVESDKKHFLIISEGSYEGGSEIGNDITVKKSNLSGKKQSTKTLEKKLANTELEFEADKIVEPSMNTRPDSSPTLRRSKAELLTIPFSWLSGGMSSSLPFKRSGKVGTSMPSASYKHNGESNLKDSSQTTAAFLGSRMSSSSKGSQVTTSNKSTNNARSKGAITNISAINHRNNELLMHHLFLKENVQFLSQLNKLLINYDSQEGDVGIDFARNMDSDSTQGNHPRITSDNIDAFIKSHFTRVISKLLEPLRLHIEENGYFDYDIFSSTFLMPTSIPKKNPSPIMSTDSIENVKDEGLSKNLNTNYSRAVKTGIMNLRQLASAQIYGQNLNLGNSNISLTESSENPLKNKRLNLGADDNTHDMFIDHQHCIDFYRRFTQTCSFGDWCQERTKMTQLAQTKKRELFGNESDEIW